MTGPRADADAGVVLVDHLPTQDIAPEVRDHSWLQGIDRDDGYSTRHAKSFRGPACSCASARVAAVRHCHFAAKRRTCGRESWPRWALRARQQHRIRRHRLETERVRVELTRSVDVVAVGVWVDPHHTQLRGGGTLA
jgi:hypothetical protein